MDNHPIPQDITGFQFKLIGKMTIKQFVYLAIGAIIAWLVFFIINFPTLIKWPLAIISISFGAMLAFVPVDGRPMDVMLRNFIKALLSPTQFIYQKAGVKITEDTLPDPSSSKAKHHFPGMHHSANTTKPVSDFPSLEKHQVAEPPIPVDPALNQVSAMPAAQAPAVSQPIMAQSLQIDIPAPAPTPAPTPSPIPAPDPQIAAMPQQIVLPPVYHNPPAPSLISMESDDESKEIKKKEKELKEAEEEKEKLKKELEELKKQLDEAMKEKEKALSAPPPPPPPTVEQLNAQNLERQLIEATRAREALERQLISEKARLQTPQQTVAPVVTAPPEATQRVRSVPFGMEKSVGIPSIPEDPNLITGIVKDPRGNPLQNILIEVKDEDSNPVRAFKTNKLGKFASATSLSNGKYTITFEDTGETHKFDAVQLELTGAPVMPLEIISVDPREELRRELFK